MESSARRRPRGTGRIFAASPGILVAALVLGGCAGSGSVAGRPEPAPAPVPEPGVRPRAPVLEDQGAELPPPPSWERLDPILDSPWAYDPAIRADVEDWKALFTGRASESFRRWLERMGRWQEIVDREIAARGLPESLRYLPLIESGYAPAVVSRASAVGMWQFMAGTATGLGLQVTPLVDERRDPLAATPRALDFLVSLRERYGSWFLALAAYNGGPGRVAYLLDEIAPGAEPGDSLFLVIRDRLPQETRLFVPKLLAAAEVARNPRRYGFGDVQPLPPIEYDEVTVPDATSVDVLARAAEVDQTVLEQLNPHLVRGLTPRGRAMGIRVPSGRGPVFERNYARIPPEERVTFVEHRVARGETLSHIALRYGVRVADIRAANPSVRPRALQIGERLIVPRAPSTVASLAAEAAIYTVQRGDTLSAIARRHGVTAGDLARANGLALDAVIRPGDRVTIPGR